MILKILDGLLKSSLFILMLITMYLVVTMAIINDIGEKKKASTIVDTTNDIIKDTGPDIRIVDRIRDSCRTDISLTYTSRQGVDELTIYCDNVLTLENLDFGSTPSYKNKKSQQLIDTEIMDE